MPLDNMVTTRKQRNPDGFGADFAHQADFSPWRRTMAAGAGDNGWWLPFRANCNGCPDSEGRRWQRQARHSGPRSPLGSWA